MDKFVFTKDGRFADAQFTGLVSVYGLAHLNARPNLSAAEAQALSVLNEVCAVLPPISSFSENFRNDASDPDEMEDFDDKSNNFIPNGTFFPSHKMCHGVLSWGNWVKNIHGNSTHFTSDPSTWGWDAVAKLNAVLPQLRALSKNHQVYINTKLLALVKKMQQEMNDGVEVRVPSVMKDLGRAVGYVVFMDTGGYAGPQWETTTIEKARTFGSEALAQEALTKRRVEGVVVKIETAVVELCGRTSEQTNQLDAVIAQLQKERLENALNSMELDDLRARVAQLEAAPSTKRKM